MKTRIILVISAIMLLGTACKEKPKPMPTATLFVGTYTNGDSEGIYTYSFDSNTGVLENRQLMAKLPNPSFLVFSKDKEHLYAVQETADFDSLGGGVTAFKLKDDVLELQNSFGTQGAHPCHVALSGEGELAVSNYTGGNLALFQLNSDGSLGGNPQVIDHKILDSTKAAHVHKAHFNSNGLFVTDLGLDAVKRYQKKNGGWETASQSTIEMPEGAGPRHFTFSTDKKFLYIINELNATITVMELDKQGGYNPIQSKSTVAADWEGVKSCADIHLSPDGRFLYGSNRGENTLVIFAVDKATGKLDFIAREGVGGDWPRNFTIDPSGSYLLVANQKSDNITVFARDREKGTLNFLTEVTTPAPVCLVFK